MNTPRRCRFTVGLGICLAALALVSESAERAAQPNAAPPALLSMSRQVGVREGWLAKRYELILPMMRAHNASMWIVVNEEFHDDPITAVIAPPRPYVGRRDFFVFVDAGEAGLKRIALTGYAEETAQRFFEAPDEPAPPAKALADLVARFHPTTIAVGMAGGRGVMHSLTYDAHRFLVETLGPETSTRLVSAEPLIEEFLDTRIPEEFPHYAALVEVTEWLARRALSNEVIAPGETSVGDVRRWLYDQSHAMGLVPWFQPDLRVQRRSTAPASSRGFLAVAREATVIMPGDVVHLDFGLNYMGLASDWQKMAYVLRADETDVPAGLKRAMANTNALQDALMRISRPGKAAGDVHAETMAEMKAKGISAQIYSHPLGNQGHALGASIDMRSANRPADIPAKRLRKGSYLAMELNTATPVAEWDGQAVTVMAEDPVYLTDDGWKLFRPRQESFYLVGPAPLTARRPVYPDGLYAEWHTTRGVIALQLEFEKAPLTVSNFVGLAEGTIENAALPSGAPFFDGTSFHRVVAGHVIQAGVPHAGQREIGYTIPNEIVPGLSHDHAGMLGMANSGPHTNSSQFYVTLGDRSYLDGSYTVFGHVVQGMEVVRRIAQGDVINHVRIVRVGAGAEAFKTDNVLFRGRLADASKRAAAADEAKVRAEEAQITKQWPKAIRSATGARYVVRRTGTGEPVQPGRTLEAVYSGHVLQGQLFCSSADEGKPTPGTVAQAFRFVAGTTHITPGLDEALLAMRPGERRTVILKGSQGYGASGFFSKEKPGEKRFVIRAHSTLVYDVEVVSIER